MVKEASGCGGGSSMGMYEKLSVSTDCHQVVSNNGSISIKPVDSSREAHERFQPIAEEAIEHEGEGYTIYPEPHPSGRYPGYDMLVLLRSTED